MRTKKSKLIAASLAFCCIVCRLHYATMMHALTRCSLALSPQVYYLFRILVFYHGIYEKPIRIFGVKIGSGCAYGRQLYLVLKNISIHKPLY